MPLQLSEILEKAIEAVESTKEGRGFYTCILLRKVLDTIIDDEELFPEENGDTSTQIVEEINFFFGIDRGNTHFEIESIFGDYLSTEAVSFRYANLKLMYQVSLDMNLTVDLDGVYIGGEME